MGETRYVGFSDSAIRRAAADEEVRDLRNERYPELRLRFRTDRRFGTWDVRHDGKWKKAGNWPQKGCGEMLDALPGIKALRARGGQPAAMIGALHTVGDLLTWWLERQLSTVTLSKGRKDSCRSVCRNWLQPCLSGIAVVDLDLPLVDRLLIRPMQAERATATVCTAYRMLIAAIHAAQGLKLLAGNPLQGVKFPQFRLPPIRPKEARLLPKNADELVARLAECFAAHPHACMLAALMLLHGTRIGETRQARWADFDLEARWWVIPASMTKTRTRHEVPLTPSAVALLRRYREALVGNPSVFLFPDGRGQPISEEAAVWIIRKLSEGAWSSHDLRKLARAGWADLGVDYLIGELLLNHAMPGLSATYVQTDLSGLKREALELWHGAGNGKAQGLDVWSRFNLLSSDGQTF